MTDSPAILVVANQPEVEKPILSVCSQHGLVAEAVESGSEALSVLSQRPVPIVLCSWRLPDMTGFRLMETVKACWPQTIIVAVFTAEDMEGSVIPRCPSAGTHLVEPFDAEAVLACLCKASTEHLRHMPNFMVSRENTQEAIKTGNTASGRPLAQILRFGELAVDLRRYDVMYGSKRIELTKTEFDILAYMAQNAERVVSYVELGRALRGPEMDEWRCREFCKNNVARLRRKFDCARSESIVIKNVKGRGYRLIRSSS